MISSPHTTGVFDSQKQVIRTVIVGVTHLSVSTGRLRFAKKATLGMTLSLRACRIAGNTLGCASASDRFFPGLVSRRLSRERRRCDTSRRTLGHSGLPARRRSGACTSGKRSCHLSLQRLLQKNCTGMTPAAEQWVSQTRYRRLAGLACRIRRGRFRRRGVDPLVFGPRRKRGTVLSLVC